MTARFKDLALIRSNIIDAGQGRSTLRLCTRRLDMMLRRDVARHYCAIHDAQIRDAELCRPSKVRPDRIGRCAPLSLFW